MSKSTVHTASQSVSSDPNPGFGKVRDIDPNVLQRKASEPDASVWVSASAGTGKTKVLTDRVLRLLLPRKDGAPATPPHKIIGLTFTKAAASEMALRINDVLGRWAILPLDAPDDVSKDTILDGPISHQKTLRAELLNLLGYEPGELEIAAARKLFAQVVDTPGGLQIMTIHSFCQSILSRFPLEAGLTPYFTLLDERQAATLLAQARDVVLAHLEHNKDQANIAEIITKLAVQINEDQFFSLMRSITSERQQFERLMKRHFNPEGFYTQICALLNVKPGRCPEEFLQEACKSKAFDEIGLRRAVDILCGAKAQKDRETGEKIDAWLKAFDEKRPALFELYQSAFLTKKDEARKKLASKAVLDQHPDIANILMCETERIITLKEKIRAASCAALSKDLFILGQAILERYKALKDSQGALDFEDLISYTAKLLSDPAMRHWVLYKLDQGLDHILIDEAQDTNPEQWEIIEALCSEFFAGKGAQDQTRTVFTVGDEKQSIYSFQRASPEEFSRMRVDFEHKIRAAEERWMQVDLNISFRSSQSVLSAVDAVFANSALRKGLSLSDIKHHSYRKGQAGLVELWPLVETPKTENTDPWAPPVTIKEKTSGAAILAQKIAHKIKGWLDNGEILSSHDRPMQPGDIMILVRTRTAFVQHLVRELKLQNIPVSGLDRMVLGDQLAVQDLLALAQFALLPEDDLTLACVLKSPLIGMSEDALYNLAVQRNGSLWDALKQSSYEDVKGYLLAVMNQGRSAPPYDFFSQILQKPCPADQVSGLRAVKKRLGHDALDPLEEFLNAALAFERDHTPALQHFLHWNTQEKVQIKREMDEGGAHVQIMTVHGAKGLQAPVVIMPDTTRLSVQSPGQAECRLLWPDKSGLSLPLWSPRASDDPALFKKGVSHIGERLDEEYRRLLYVAMTRAEDRLYVAGYKTLKEPLDNSWYFFVKSGLEAHPHCEELDCGALRLVNPQTKDPDRAKPLKKSANQEKELPQWLFLQAPKEDEILRKVAPSRILDEVQDERVASPLQKGDTYRFRRGNLTHKLLEILPDLCESDRAKAGDAFLERYGHDLPKTMRANIMREVLSILSHENFAQIFGPGSMAEVPLTGHLEDGRIVQGQIDRLLVTDRDIWIIDYKTNRPPPQCLEDVPALYIGQMKAYATVLEKLYPDRKLHCALLWTDGPQLMELA